MKSNGKILLLILLISFTTTLNAQKKKDIPETYYGLNFGMIASKINFNPAVDQTFLTGYNGGLISDI